jgi:hypothetical protein
MCRVQAYLIHVFGRGGSAQRVEWENEEDRAVYETKLQRVASAGSV